MVLSKTLKTVKMQMYSFWSDYSYHYQSQCFGFVRAGLLYSSCRCMEATLWQKEQFMRKVCWVQSLF